MREVGIVGVGHTKFGTATESFSELCCLAALEALDDAGIKTLPGHGVDQVFVATMGVSSIQHQVAFATALVDTLNLRPAMAECVENGCAAGSSAVKLGYAMIASELADVVLVVGAEKMSDLPSPKANDFVSTMLHQDAEYLYGLNYPSAAAMFTRLRMDTYGVDEHDLALVAAKNHSNAMNNPVAVSHTRFDADIVTNREKRDATDPFYADPLRLSDMNTTCDGAAALVLCAVDVADRFSKKPIKIVGIGQATDTHAIAERAVPTDLLAVRTAAQRAYEMSGKTPGDIDVAELHDAFTILEIVESEEVGFFPKGEGHLALRRGETQIGGRIPLNTSGGLNAKGHVLGATGVSQVCEIVRQLRGEAHGRQVEGARTGMTVNFGGFGNNVVALILTNEE